MDRDIYCTPDYFNCGTNLDLEIQEDFITKLKNPDNFGPSGIVPYKIEVIELLDTVSLGTQLQDSLCNIFYVGSFPISFPNGTTEIDIDESNVSVQTLQTIKEWSQKCTQNVAFIFHSEAKAWGFDFGEGNENPNSPFGSYQNSFFLGNSSFGSMTEFKQGGAVQEVLEYAEHDDFSILAVDANENPTIIWDHLTHDFVFGDIGFFSSTPPIGHLSSGNEVVTSNDRLAMKMVELAIEIMQYDTIISFSDSICIRSPFNSEFGDIVPLEEGIYLDPNLNNYCDTLVTYFFDFILNPTYISLSTCEGSGFEYVHQSGVVINESNLRHTLLIDHFSGCDSLVFIDLNVYPVTDSLFQPLLCENYNHEWIIGNTLYNKENPTGVEILTNSNGCDSIVTIDIKFDIPVFERDTLLIFCESSDDHIEIGGQFFSSSPLLNQPYRVKVESSLGCDSIIYVYQQILEDSDSFINFSLCDNSDSIIVINGTEYGVLNLIGQEILMNSNGCDSLIRVNIGLIETYDFVENYSLCRGDSLFINGRWFHENHTFEIFDLSAINTCDSIVEVEVEILEESQNEILEVICTVDSVYVHGDFYKVGETPIVVIQNRAGCDSTIYYAIEALDEDELIVQDEPIFIFDQMINEVSLSNPNNFDLNWYLGDSLICLKCNKVELDYKLLDLEKELRVIYINSHGCRNILFLNLFRMKLPYIPNAFSPNADGINDVFEMFIDPRLNSQDIEIVEFKLYDRRGTLMQEHLREPINGSFVLWDGYDIVQVASPGLYLYSIKLSYPEHPEVYLTGEVHLIN